MICRIWSADGITCAANIGEIESSAIGKSNWTGILSSMKEEQIPRVLDLKDQMRMALVLVPEGEHWQETEE